MYEIYVIINFVPVQGVYADHGKILVPFVFKRSAKAVSGLICMKPLLDFGHWQLSWKLDICLGFLCELCLFCDYFNFSFPICKLYKLFVGTRGEIFYI